MIHNAFVATLKNCLNRLFCVVQGKSVANLSMPVKHTRVRYLTALKIKIAAIFHGIRSSDT